MVKLKSITLPCKISTLESIITQVAHIGHWDDAMVYVNDNELIIAHPNKENNTNENKQQKAR